MVNASSGVGVAARSPSREMHLLGLLQQEINKRELAESRVKQLELENSQLRSRLGSSVAATQSEISPTSTAFAVASMSPRRFAPASLSKDTDTIIALDSDTD